MMASPQGNLGQGAGDVRGGHKAALGPSGAIKKP